MSVWRSLLRAGGFGGQSTTVASIPAPSGPQRVVARPAGATPRDRAARLEQTLTEYIDTLGAQHHRSIAARNNLATKYAQIGRRHEAIEQFLIALADSADALGAHDPQTDVIRENLACCYEDTGANAEAAQHWETLLQSRQERLGETAEETVNARASLARAYRRTGRNDAAIAHFERAIADWEGPSPSRAEGLRIGLALALHNARRLDDATRQYRMVQAQRRRRLGADHHDTLIVQHRLGRIYLEAERDTEAIEALERTYRYCLASAGDPDIRVLTMKVRRDLARAYRAAGRTRDAAALH